MTKLICLLRAINLGARKVPMSDLRDMAEAMGLKDPQTLLASGNLVVEAEGADPRDLEARLEAAFAPYFGFSTDFIVRTPAQWRSMIDACPFPEEAAAQPSRLLVTVMKGELAADAVDTLGGMARAGEKVAEAAGALWIWFPGGIADSRLSTAQAQKALGGPGTARNWNTVLKLAALAEA